MPAIIKRYRTDFKGDNRDLLSYLSEFLTEEDAQKAKRLVEKKSAPKFKFQPFDWTPPNVSDLKLTRENSLTFTN